MKNNIKIILAFILGGLIFGSIGTVFALTYRASDITYTPTDNTWNVTTVGEAINDLALSKTSDNYSTTEKVVGTWINGKPLYQKTIVGKSPNSTGSWVNIGSNISDVEYVQFIRGVMLFSSGVYFNIEAYLDYMAYKISNGQVQLLIGNGFNDFKNKDIYITLQYTKTTDTASN